MSRHQSTLARVLGLLALLLTLSETTVAQSPPIPGLPENWKSLSSEDFKPVMETFFSQTPSPSAADAKEVAQHAWETFLATPQASMDLSVPTATALMKMVRPRQSTLIPIATPPVQREFREGMNARWVDLAEQVLNQLQAESLMTGNLSISAINDWSSIIAEAPQTHSIKALAEALATTWLASNDPLSLGNSELLALHSMLKRDLVNPALFSARWSGTLTPPSTGHYQFEQIRTDGGNGGLKIWLDETLVLDTTLPAANCSRVAADFRGTAIPLQQGQTRVLRAEFSYDKNRLAHRYDDLMGTYLFPRVLVYWRKDDGERQLIPQSAFAPPADLAPAGTAGLKAEYFNDVQLGELVQSRLDPGLGVLNCSTIAPAQLQAYRKIVEEVWRRCLPNAAATEALHEENFLFFHSQIPYEVNAWQALDLMDRLTRSSSLLSKLDNHQFRATWVPLGVMTGSERVRYFTTWVTQRPVPVADLYRLDKTAYYSGNHQIYRNLGRWFHGPDDQDLLDLWHNHTSAEDGSCRLYAFAVAVYAFIDTHRHRELKQLIHDKLAALPATGDATATWLWARAVAKEAALLDLQTRPELAREDLTHAYLAASSQVLKQKLQREWIMRQFALNQIPQALEEITQTLANNPGPEWQKELETLKTRGEALLPRMRSWEQEQIQATAAARHDAELVQLRERLEKAQGRGDDEAAAKYQARIQALTNN